MNTNKSKKKRRVWLWLLITVIVIIIVIAVASKGNPGNVTIEDIKAKGLSAVKWNTKDEDALKNGNIQLASKLLLGLDNKELEKAKMKVSSALVLKTPWKYYGKYIDFSGTIGMIKDYQPGSDISKNIAQGKECFEVHIITDDDMVLVGFFGIGSSGKLKEGDSFELRGFPVGLIQNTNVLGGKISELVVIGKTE